MVTFKPVGLNKERLVALMAERKLDGLFLASPENVFYTTGYPTLPGSGNPIIYAMRNQFPFFSFADKSGNISLICWGGAAMGIEFGTEDVRPFFMYSMVADELTNLIKEKLQPGCTVGVESTFPFFATQLIWEHGKPASMLNADDVMSHLRIIKSPMEIEYIKRSTAIIDKTVIELADNLKLGMTRLDLIREAKYRMIKNGAGGVDHVTVAFGPANPEVALDEKLEKDQIVTLDLGASYEGYASDNRRLVYTGKVPDALKDTHQKLCWVVDEMGKALKPGKTFAELHAYAFELYAKVGVDPLFLHAGHSIGLQVDEHWLLGDDPTPVQENMVLNIELYTTSNEGVMVGDEETFVVTRGDPIKLSTLPVNIIEKQL